MIDYEKRNQELIRYYLRGNLMSECAERYGISLTRVQQILARHNIRTRSKAEANAIARKKGRMTTPYSLCGPPGPDDPEREAKIINLVIGKGLTYGQAAHRLGVSRSLIAGAVYRYKHREAA